MAKLTVDEVLNRGYLTDVALAAKLRRGELALDNPIIMAAITQTSAYIATYGSEETPKETPSTVDNGGDTNSIKFYVDGTEYIYTGKPSTAAITTLKSLEITDTLYLDGVEFVAKGKKATDLAGLELTTSLPIDDAPATDDAPSEDQVAE